MKELMFYFRKGSIIIMEETDKSGEYYMTPEEREETINRIVEKIMKLVNNERGNN